MQPIYYDRLDRVITQSDLFTQNQFVGFDPLMVDNTPPATRLSAEGATGFAIWAPGEWDKVNNIQKVYAGPNTGQNVMSLLDHAGENPTYTVLDSTPFPAPLNILSSPGASSIIGFKTQLSGVSGCVSTNTIGNLIVFETAGYALQSGIAVRHTDNNFYCSVLGQIDLTTGRCGPDEGNGTGRIVPDIPIAYVSNPTEFQTTVRFGNSIFFDSVQFAPDNDSTPAVPKGRLIFSTGHEANATLQTGNSRRLYVKVVEWNPTGVAAVPGNPNRVQARELLFSRFTLLVNTEPESGGIGSSSSNLSTRAIFHPPTETMRVYVDDEVGGDDVMDVYELVAEFSSLGPPTAETTVETGKVVTFGLSAAGTLGEPVPNRKVDWSLLRASSVEEVVNTVGLPATSTLANPPVDDDGTLTLIDNEDNTLVEGAGPGGDFTIVLSTGVITWENGPNGNHPKAESGYTATYAHRTNSASPSHGTLLNTRSSTDTNGKAIARIKYPADDDLVGAIDEITSTDAG